MNYSHNLWHTSLLAGCLLALTQCSGAVSRNDPGLTLRVLHINDTHSHFDATAAQVHPGPAADILYTFIGGHPRIMARAGQERERARAQGIPSLFLHGGDAFKGSAYFELFEHHINIDILNRMGLDAMALGNHEFDIGLEKLAEFIHGVDFPILAANVDARDEPLLASAGLLPYQLFVARGDALRPIVSQQTALPANTLAVIGLALEDMPGIAPATGNLRFSAEVASAQALVDNLHARGVRHIIALTHLGHQRDLRLASEVNGIDVIVGGHSHSLLGDFSHWSLGNQAAYAQRITNPDGAAQTCVVQAGQFAQALGAVTVRFDASGRITECEGENTLLASRDVFLSAQRDESSRPTASQQVQMEQWIEALPRTSIVDEHQGLRQRLDSAYRPTVLSAYGRQIGQLSQTLEHVRLPGSDGSDEHGSLLAGLIADGMQSWLNRPDVQSQLQRRVDFTLIGAGNIRSALQPGAVHEGHITMEVLPFDTPLSVIEIRGDQLAALLTDVISATLSPGAHAGKYPYTSHLRYVAQEQEGFQALLTRLQHYQQGHWTDVDRDALYTLATTSYLADGNDGWGLLADLPLAQSRRVDLILRNGTPELFAVADMRRNPGLDGDRRTELSYQRGSTLPCSAEGFNCKVAAQAFIDYLSMNPGVLLGQREPTVTLLRRSADAATY
jgi:5'-nucleotidase